MIVKRLIGTPGDTIEMRDNFVLVNGEAVDEPYVARPDEATDPRDAMMRSWQAKYLTGDLDIRSYRPTLKNWGPLVVPSDSFFVMGDNRDRSYDSRYWGFLGVNRIQGRPLVIYYSYDRNGVTPLPFITAVRWGRIGQRFEWGKALKILCCRDD